MSIDPQMLAAMLMQGQQGQQSPAPGGIVPKQGIAGGAAQGGSDFLKMMMLQKQPGQMPPVPQMPQNTAPQMPPQTPPMPQQ